jgi:hypothetical protein
LFSVKRIVKDRQAGPLLADQELVRSQLLCCVLVGSCSKRSGKNGGELRGLRPGGWKGGGQFAEVGREGECVVAKRVVEGLTLG